MTGPNILSPLICFRGSLDQPSGKYILSSWRKKKCPEIQDHVKYYEMFLDYRTQKELIIHQQFTEELPRPFFHNWMTINQRMLEDGKGGSFRAKASFIFFFFLYLHKMNLNLTERNNIFTGVLCHHLPNNTWCGSIRTHILSCRNTERHRWKADSKMVIARAFC